MLLHAARFQFSAAKCDNEENDHLMALPSFVLRYLYSRLLQHQCKYQYTEKAKNVLEEYLNSLCEFPKSISETPRDLWSAIWATLYSLKTLSWALDPYAQWSTRCPISTTISRILFKSWSYNHWSFLFPQAGPLSFPILGTHTSHWS